MNIEILWGWVVSVGLEFNVCAADSSELLLLLFFRRKSDLIDLDAVLKGDARGVTAAEAAVEAPVVGREEDMAVEGGVASVLVIIGFDTVSMCEG